MTSNVKDWNTELVSKWLWSLNLGHLTNKFEGMRVDGPTLLRMDDTFIDSRLRLNPAEKTAFNGALHMLRSNSIYGTTISNTLPAPSTVRSSPRLSNVDSSGRPRFDSDAAKHPVVKIIQQSSDPSRNQQPEVKLGPAIELVRNCRHSGWIRKQGGSDNKKGWRQRYMILRTGHLYYYDKETSVKAKGYFSIQGYRVDRCTESYKGKPFCCKLIPDNPSERTYVVAVAAEHELDKWMEEIQAEIDSYEDHVYDPVAIEEEDEEDVNYEPMDGNDGIYDDLDDPGYVKLDEFVKQPPVAGSSNLSQTFPRNTSNNSDIIPPSSPKRLMTSTLPAKNRSGSASPYVPPRSRESLAGVSTVAVVAADKEEDPYMSLIDQNSPTPPISQSIPTNSTLSPPTDKPSINNNNYRPVRRSTEAVVNTPHPLIKETPQEYTEEEIANEDPYYIRLEQMDDLMPDYCRFGSISRDDAVKKLTSDSHGNPKFTRPGVYLIRDSSHQDVLHVLSVWTGTECKHYKLFYKDGSDEEVKGYCLTQGKRFPTIPLLLSYYKQEDLPRSPLVTLSDPYHPDDH